MQRHAFLVGETDEPDFRQLIAWLASRCTLTCWTSIAEICDRSQELPVPELITFVQSRPGQFQRREIEQLHHHWPLSRLVMVLSSWCEGETRTGKPLPGVWRIYWYDFVRRMTPVFDTADGAISNSWHLPRSATDNERQLHDLIQESPKSRGTVYIAANSRVAYEAIADACRELGLNTVWHSSAERESTKAIGYAAGIWNARRGDEAEWVLIRAFARSLKPAPVLVIQGFPRLDQVEQANRDGLVLLAKPFQLPDLWQALSTMDTIES